MKGLITLFSLLFFSALSIESQGQTDRARTLIQEDYVSILNGINELKHELRSTSDKSLISELKNAQTGLINDYTSGPYALFESKATIESAFVQSVGKFNEDNIKSFLTNYSGKNYTSAKIDVENVKSMSGKSNWYEVYYTSSGEVTQNKTNRVAIVSISGDQTRIRRISYADRGPIKAPIAESHPSDKKKVVEQSVVPSPQVTEEPVPMITMSAPALSTQNELVLSGSITNQKADGVISAYIDDKFLDGLRYNLSQNQYHITIPNSAIPQNSRSFDVVFRYDYGKKFIKVRRNLVMLPKELITNTETTPTDRMMSAVSQED